MKKIKLIIIIAVVLLLVFLTCSGFTGMYVANHYKKLTIEETLQNQQRLLDFGCAGKINPAAYGFSDYEDIHFMSSLNKKIMLSGWYIRTGSKTGKLLLITEGRWVNRLKAIKYLELLKNTGIDQEYDIYIGDMRNAGDSSCGNTGFGYYIAEDMAATVLFLNQTYKNTCFVIWGFSQSGIAGAILSDRQDLQKKIKEQGITIEKTILDSPLSNALEMLKIQAKNIHVPTIIAHSTQFFMFLNDNFYAYRMRLGILLRNPSYPFLILQSEKDELTLYSLFKEESKTFSPMVKIKQFSTGAHVSSYLVPENKPFYETEIKDFLLSNK